MIEFFPISDMRIEDVERVIGMAEYSVWIEFEGQGSVKVRANSEAEAEEDAKQMDLADINESILSIRVVRVKEVQSNA